MRIALCWILLGTLTVFALEIIFTDKQRTEMSAAVFTGTVTNIQHVPLVEVRTSTKALGDGTRVVWADQLERVVRESEVVERRINATNNHPCCLIGRTSDRGVWRAEVLVESVAKQDVALGQVATVYYEQKPGMFNGVASFGGRACPGYPVIETNMHATFWC